MDPQTKRNRVGCTEPNLHANMKRSRTQSRENNTTTKGHPEITTRCTEVTELRNKQNKIKVEVHKTKGHNLERFRPPAPQKSTLERRENDVTSREKDATCHEDFPRLKRQEVRPWKQFWVVLRVRRSVNLRGERTPHT